MGNLIEQIQLGLPSQPCFFYPQGSNQRPYLKGPSPIPLWYNIIFGSVIRTCELFVNIAITLYGLCLRLCFYFWIFQTPSNIFGYLLCLFAVCRDAKMLIVLAIFLIFFFWAVNRRLDEWVKLDQLDLESVEAVVDEKVEEKVMIYIF